MITYSDKMELRKYLINARLQGNEELSTMTEEIINTIGNHLDSVLSLPQDNSERIKYEPRVIQIENALRNQDYSSFRSSAYFFMNLLTL